MTHPDWALKYKTKGTELRCINGKYYLYKVTSKWNKEKKISQKITGEMIGRITLEDGLIRKGQKKVNNQPSLETHSSSTKELSTSISSLEYGATFFLFQLAEVVISSLKKHYPYLWKEVFVLALNRLLYQAPLKNMEFLYESSFLSQDFPGLDLSKNRLTSLMKELGQDRTKITSLMKSFIQGADHIVFDTTHLVSQSEKMQLNQPGYNSQGSFDPQVNLLYMFSTDRQFPVFYRIFPGNIQGMKALQLTVQESGIQDCTVIGDKGFGSENNIGSIESIHLNYHLPLKRNNSLINYERLFSRNYDDAYDGHFMYNERVIFYYRYTIDSWTDYYCTFLQKTPDEDIKVKEKELVIFVDNNVFYYQTSSNPPLKIKMEKDIKEILIRWTKIKEDIIDKSGQEVIIKNILKLPDRPRELILFYDPVLRTEEERWYLNRVENKCDGYDMVGYKEKNICFGTLSVLTSLKEEPAEKIYQKYKSRMEVEGVFDMYKSLLNVDRSYVQSDSSFEAWTFINHLSTIMYYLVFQLLKKHDKLSSVSPKELLLKLSRVQKLKVGDRWVTSEINSSALKLFTQLEIHIT